MSRILFRACAALTGCFAIVVVVGLFLGVSEVMKLGLLGAGWSVFGMFVNSRFFFGGKPG